MIWPVVEISENKLLVKDYKTGTIRTVFIKNSKQKQLNIQDGMKSYILLKEE